MVIELQRCSYRDVATRLQQAAPFVALYQGGARFDQQVKGPSISPRVLITAASRLQPHPLLFTECIHVSHPFLISQSPCEGRTCITLYERGNQGSKRLLIIKPTSSFPALIMCQTLC